MKNKNKSPIAPGWLMLLGCSTLLAFPWGHAQAQSFDLENGVTIDWDTSLAYGAAWRVQGQNSPFAERLYYCGQWVRSIDGQYRGRTSAGQWGH